MMENFPKDQIIAVPPGISHHYGSMQVLYRFLWMHHHTLMRQVCIENIKWTVFVGHSKQVALGLEVR
jgi:hypothetical protein